MIATIAAAARWSGPQVMIIAEDEGKEWAYGHAACHGASSWECFFLPPSDCALQNLTHPDLVGLREAGFGGAWAVHGLGLWVFHLSVVFGPPIPPLTPLRCCRSSPHEGVTRQWK